MSGAVELAIVGAGPAGLAAALQAAELGFTPAVFDEQAAPGGQIYRNVEAVAAGRADDLALLGPDYAEGLALVQAFRGAGLDYRPMSAVFEVRSGGLGVLSAGRARMLGAREVLVATGAMERPVPIPGWTLPGVIGAGAAQTLLKASNVVPQGPLAVAGSGPLVLLAALQLARAGADLRVVLETVPRRQYLAACHHLPRAALEPELWKGLGWQRELRRLGVETVRGVTGLRAEGAERLEAVRYVSGSREARLEVRHLLLHEGVVPNLQLTRAAGCRHLWDAVQRCWRPALDAFGATGVAGLSVAGDGAGIAGARAAASRGRLAALGAAHRLGRIDAGERDRRAAPHVAALRRQLRLRPLLDALYRPADAMVVPADDATLVCRCEEVTAGELRRVAALGVPGPNQAKSFTRAGMGPCQGRMCGLTVAELLAQASGRPVAEVGHYRIRPPVKPVTVAELAALDGAELPAAYAVSSAGAGGEQPG